MRFFFFPPHFPFFSVENILLITLFTRRGSFNTKDCWVQGLIDCRQCHRRTVCTLTWVIDSSNWGHGYPWLYLERVLSKQQQKIFSLKWKSPGVQFIKSKPLDILSWGLCFSCGVCGCHGPFPMSMSTGDTRVYETEGVKGKRLTTGLSTLISETSFLRRLSLDVWT